MATTKEKILQLRMSFFKDNYSNNLINKKINNFKHYVNNKPTNKERLSKYFNAMSMSHGTSFENKKYYMGIDEKKIEKYIDKQSTINLMKRGYLIKSNNNYSIPLNYNIQQFKENKDINTNIRKKILDLEKISCIKDSNEAEDNSQRKGRTERKSEEMSARISSLLNLINDKENKERENSIKLYRANSYRSLENNQKIKTTIKQLKKFNFSNSYKHTPSYKPLTHRNKVNTFLNGFTHNDSDSQVEDK